METQTDNFRRNEDCFEFSPSTEELQCCREPSVTRTIITIVCRQASTCGQRIQFSNAVTTHRANTCEGQLYDPSKQPAFFSHN